MKVDVSVKQENTCSLEHIFIGRVVEETLKQSGLDLDEKTIHVGVADVELQEMQDLNKKYRGKDTPTDVLSFPEYESMEDVQSETENIITLGDIILSCEVVKKQAKEDGVTFDRELAYLISHGALHLLGLEHGEKMFSIQDEVCDILDEVKST